MYDMQKKWDEDELHWITAIISPDLHQEQHFCEDCKRFFEPSQLFFQVLDGPIYTKKNRPPFWENDIPMDDEHFHDIKNVFLDPLPLHLFPLIEDFDILLERVISKYEDGEETDSDVFLWMFSPSRGYLAHFLNNALHYMRQSNFLLPHGSVDAPYYNLDEGWHIMLFEDDTYIYILTGNWSRNPNSFETWFKVEMHLYYHQWERTIERCRDIPEHES